MATVSFCCTVLKSDLGHHWVMHFKWVNVTICELYLKGALKNDVLSSRLQVSVPTSALTPPPQCTWLSASPSRGLSVPSIKWRYYLCLKGSKEENFWSSFPFIYLTLIQSRWYGSWDRERASSFWEPNSRSRLSSKRPPNSKQSLEAGNGLPAHPLWSRAVGSLWYWSGNFK